MNMLKKEFFLWILLIFLMEYRQLLDIQLPSVLPTNLLQQYMGEHSKGEERLYSTNRFDFQQIVVLESTQKQSL